MKTCYLTGKMRGVKCLNFPLFNHVTRILRADGWNVISPVEMDREAKEPWCSETDPDFADENFQISDADCRRLIRRDVDAILTLRPKTGDRIILIPGWDDESTGAFGECGVGRWAMIPLMEFTEIEVQRLRKKANAQNTYKLREVTQDEWGAKANMRATEKYSDE